MDPHAYRGCSFSDEKRRRVSFLGKAATGMILADFADNAERGLFVTLTEGIVLEDF